MTKERITAVQHTIAGHGAVRDTRAWNALIDRYYTTIEWIQAQNTRDIHGLPSPIVHMQLKSKRHFFGLLSKMVTRVTLSQAREDLDIESTLFSLGLALQGDLYLRRRHKEKRDHALIRGPRADLSAMRVILKADIFVSLLLYSTGDSDVITRRARRRAEAMLVARHGVDPGLFALPLATDTIQVVLPSTTGRYTLIDHFMITEALARAEDVSRCIDQSSLSDWFGFGQAAQDMAWRSASKRTILGSAFLADAPAMRTIAMSIAELTKLEPHTADQLGSNYSSFVDHDINAGAHHRAMNEEFDWVMAQDPIKNGSRVFLQAADRQIHNLQRGQVIGWCADALHVSAKAFDDNGGNSAEALSAAREAFEGHKNNNTWDQLSRLGEQIVDVCRKGLLMDVRDLYELAAQHANLDGLRNALDAHIMTINPPQNGKQLAPSFAAPALQAPAPQAPTYTPLAAPHRAPSLGLGGSSGARVLPTSPPQENEEQRT